MVALMAPFSHGSIRLASPTPGASPIINPRYNSDDRDTDRMIHGLRVAREIGSAPALAHWQGRKPSQARTSTTTKGCAPICSGISAPTVTTPAHARSVSMRRP
ncbi:GMC oxidoreductase [Streptomyces atratus]|uniref:GMC oxidoreductase n=1 Tax=Streptomyces atratus TaxID=1893 RepID=UPI0033908640